MMAVPTVYEVVKFAGGAYLIYLGVRTLITRQAKDVQTPIEVAKLWTIFLQGVITNVLNQKVALFFLAFLPQFVNRNASVAPQIIFLGILFNTSGSVVNVIVAFLASHADFQFKTRMGNSTIFRWLTGGIFIGLGVRLALLERK